MENDSQAERPEVDIHWLLSGDDWRPEQEELKAELRPFEVHLTVAEAADLVNRFGNWLPAQHLPIVHHEGAPWQWSLAKDKESPTWASFYIVVRGEAAGELYIERHRAEECKIGLDWWKDPETWRVARALYLMLLHLFEHFTRDKLLQHLRQHKDDGYQMADDEREEKERWQERFRELQEQMDQLLAKQGDRAAEVQFSRIFEESVAKVLQAERPAYTFRKASKRQWEIAFRGDLFKVNEMQGFHVIRFLLDNPRQEFYCTQLLAMSRGEMTAADVVSERERLDAGITINDQRKQDVTDEAYRQKVTTRLAFLRFEQRKCAEAIHQAQKRGDQKREQREKQNLLRTEREIAEIEPFLTDLGGTFKDQATTDSDRLRKQHRRAMKHIRDCDEDLWWHLKHFMKVGAVSYYYPDIDLEWKTRDK